jgi:uncharacterized membrane protein HdeD (DUF308 family)
MLSLNQKLPTFSHFWHRFFIFGIVLTLLGAFAIYTATSTTFLTVMLIGFFIFCSGAVMVFDTLTFWRGKWSGFSLHFILALLYLYVGIILIKNPVQGSISLTFLLATFFIVAGICRMAFYSLLQTPQWGWGFLNGIITLLIGILIMNSWPSSSLFVIGLFVGIDLVLCGWTYMMSALAAKQLVRAL